MKLIALPLLAAAGLLVPFPQDPDQPDIESKVIDTEGGARVLLQDVRVAASVDDVWNAYVTEAGWTAWASPVAKIDLRPGGTIRTHYGENAKIGDDGTNTLHIVNFVPKRLLTLRAELAANWPEVMKQDADNLMNVIVFTPLGEKSTRIESYGVGYRKSKAYDQLMKFFIPANEGLFRKLKQVLEK